MNYPIVKTTMENIEKMIRQEAKPEGPTDEANEEQKARTEEEGQETQLEAASASEAAAASEAAPASEEVAGDNGLIVRQTRPCGDNTCARS